MERFVLIGAAGYIAERHMKAIRETGSNLVGACDMFDVMGRIDSYFPEAEFFADTGSLGRFLSETRNRGEAVDWASICTPNYLHSQHIGFALRNGANAICEKPMVIYPDEIGIIKKIEAETGKKAFTVLQLRYHPAILKLKEKIDEGGGKIYDIDLSYITSRGKWYAKSWKGDSEKSGGIATNIGIHFFDMITWIFGPVKMNVVHLYEPNRAAGLLLLGKARVRWFLSIDYHDLPAEVAEKGGRTYRSITVDGEEIEFSGGFADLHTTTYRNILGGNGFGIEDASESIRLTHEVRNAVPAGLKGDYHPFLEKLR